MRFGGPALLRNIVRLLTGHLRGGMRFRASPKRRTFRRYWCRDSDPIDVARVLPTSTTSRHSPFLVFRTFYTARLPQRWPYIRPTALKTLSRFQKGTVSLIKRANSSADIHSAMSAAISMYSSVESTLNLLFKTFAIKHLLFYGLVFPRG